MESVFVLLQILLLPTFRRGIEFEFLVLGKKISAHQLPVYVHLIGGQLAREFFLRLCPACRQVLPELNFKRFHGTAKPHHQCIPIVQVCLDDRLYFGGFRLVCLKPINYFGAGHPPLLRAGRL